MRKDFWSTHFLLSEFPEGADDSQGNVTVTLFEAVDRQGVQWYRCRCRSDSDAIEWNILGNEASGYQPVYMAKTGNSQDIEVLKQLIWERIGGVYLPAEVYRVSYSDDGELSDRRHTVINNIKIQTRRSKLFTYQGMGYRRRLLMTHWGKVFKFRAANRLPRPILHEQIHDTRLIGIPGQHPERVVGAVLVGISIIPVSANSRQGRRGALKRFHFGGGPVYLLSPRWSLFPPHFAGEVCVMLGRGYVLRHSPEWTELDAMRGSNRSPSSSPRRIEPERGFNLRRQFDIKHKGLARQEVAAPGEHVGT